MEQQRNHKQSESVVSSSSQIEYDLAWVPPAARTALERPRPPCPAPRPASATRIKETGSSAYCCYYHCHCCRAGAVRPRSSVAGQWARAWSAACRPSAAISGPLAAWGRSYTQWLRSIEMVRAVQHSRISRVRMSSRQFRHCTIPSARREGGSLDSDITQWDSSADDR